MKKAATLQLNKERLRVLSSQSLQAAVGGDEYDWYGDGEFDLVDGPNTMNVYSQWRKYYADSVYYGDANWGGGSGWYI